MMPPPLPAQPAAVASIQLDAPLTRRQIEQRDLATRREASALATRPVPRSEILSRVGPHEVGSYGPWIRVQDQDLVRRNQTSGNIYLNKRRYSVRVVVDYDRDGRPDIAELVENRQEAGIRLTFGSHLSSAIIFSTTGRWVQEELLPAGRYRIYLAKPELGYSLFFRNNGQDRAYHAGD